MVFPHTALESDIFDITFPDGYAIDELPQAVKHENSFANYKSELRVTEHLLHYSRTYELKDVRLPVAQLEKLKTLYRQIADDERAYAILKSS
jgi:hypothetical protein